MTYATRLSTLFDLILQKGKLSLVFAPAGKSTHFLPNYLHANSAVFLCECAQVFKAVSTGEGKLILANPSTECQSSVDGEKLRLPPGDNIS